MLNNDGKRKLLAYNIAKYRKLKGLSQNQLAEMVNKSREHIAKIETAKRNLSIDLLFTISSVLKVKEVELFDFN